MKTLGRLIGWLRPYLHWLVGGGILMATAGGLMAAVVATMKPLVNRVMVSDAIPVSAAPDGFAGSSDILSRVQQWVPADTVMAWLADRPFVQVPLLMVTIFFFRGVFLYFGHYLTIKAGASVIRDIRAALYESVTYQSLSFFQSHPTGLLLSRILNDVERLRRLFLSVLAELFRVGAQIPFLFATALWHDWRITLGTMISLPLLAYPTMRIGRRLRRASTVSQEHMAVMANRVTEAVTGVKVVQGFGMEAFEIGRFREALDGMLRADLRAGRASSLAPSVMELLGALVGAGLFLTAGYGIARGKLDAGDFTVVLFALGLFFASLRRLATQYTELQQALAAADRVFDVLDREREIRDRPDAEELPPFAESIEFRGVRFSYGDDNVLDGLDLSIRKGEVIALVGASGSGKSTLVNLIPRFYDPTAGSLVIDGRDLCRVKLESLRAQIGIVTQETILFDDTVRGNIAYGRGDIPLERIRESARAAHADEFIDRLPNGYDTVLGERGTRLSMGQRQRITIARALLKAPPILILDEATSALDTESEALVQSALNRLMEGRTAVVIAHRLSTIRRADRILVMSDGRIVEEGTHDELLERAGAYSRLHQLQFRESDS